MHASLITTVGAAPAESMAWTFPVSLLARLTAALARLRQRMVENAAAARASGLLDRPAIARRVMG
jgi:hypothetical protein